MDDVYLPMEKKGSTSFASKRFNESAIREDYGLCPEDDNFEKQEATGYFELETQEVNSDNHGEKVVKRSNLLKLFLQGIEIDKYIIAN